MKPGILRLQSARKALTPLERMFGHPQVLAVFVDGVMLVKTPGEDGASDRYKAMSPGEFAEAHKDNEDAAKASAHAINDFAAGAAKAGNTGVVTP